MLSENTRLNILTILVLPAILIPLLFGGIASCEDAMNKKGPSPEEENIAPAQSF